MDGGWAECGGDSIKVRTVFSSFYFGLITDQTDSLIHNRLPINLRTSNRLVINSRLRIKLAKIVPVLPCEGPENSVHQE